MATRDSNNLAVNSGSVAEIIKRKLEQARNQLIDRNLRNKLVNCSLTSKRSKQVRIVDEVPDEVFRILLSQRKSMVFAAGRGLTTEGTAAEDLDFVTTWVPPENDHLDEHGVAERHRDNALQTQLTPEGLQKRLTSLYYESREVEEEQGVNVLYLALGFLKWFEDARSEVERFAPLVLLPVELTREGARDSFRLKVRDEDLITNISLKVWLAEQHSVNLPDLPDGDEWTPSQYLSQVRIAISKTARWEVLDNEILLSFFSFSKFLLWRDLDPKNWPSAETLLNHTILRTLLAPAEEDGVYDPPIIPDDARIDEVFRSADQVYVLDADSSQTVAIQTSLAGRNLVVQGPPGTGKSQTIANLIAAAVHRGKTVLFVAEKLAALEVVYDRLKAVGLGTLCLELHSRKSSKQQVLAQIRQAINAPVPPGAPGNLCQSLDKVIDTLWTHSDRIHRPQEPMGCTPFQVLGSICRLRDNGISVPDFKIRGAETWSKVRAEDFLQDTEELAERLKLSGVPARHPWRECKKASLNPLDLQRLKELAAKLHGNVESLHDILQKLWPLIKPAESAILDAFPFRNIDLIELALALAAKQPEESMSILCHPRWRTDLDHLNELVSVCQCLDEIETALDPVFVSAAWSRDWSSERADIVGVGESIFRVFRKSYRVAMRTYRGACKKGLPKTYLDRVAALDHLINGQTLRRKLADLQAHFGADLGALWTTLPEDWRRLSSLRDWLEEATALEPQLSVRNTTLLGWSDNPQAWCDKLRELAGALVPNARAVTSFVDLSNDTLGGTSQGPSATIGVLRQRAEEWRDSPERYNEWPPVRIGLDMLREHIIGDFVDRIYSGHVSPLELSSRVRLAILEQQWNAMCKTDEELSRMDGRVLDQAVQKFRELDEKRKQSAAQEVLQKHCRERPTGNAGEMGVIWAELNKSRRLLPVRRLMDTAGGAIQRLKPMFLMSPLSVAQYLAPGRVKFDLLLIDEASQVRPADALGSVARSGQVVVVGDPKQLPPTNFFNRLVDDGDGIDDNTADGDGPSVGSMESILSLCEATFSNRTMLRWHYRSQHPALIAVSNRNFYDNKLLLPPSVIAGLSSDGFGIRFHKTPAGAYDRGSTATNIVEADIVADAVCSFARQNPNKSLGVGTFSVAQRDVIRDRIDQRRREEPSLEEFFAASREHPFFVKNLESIQGDERDTIFISVGYGRDRDGRLTQNFGPIGSNGGERRLNVLISRARERCEVFSPITADDISVSGEKPGVIAFKEFLQFAEKGYFDVPRPDTGRTFDSDFEESVALFLRQRGYKVDPQVGMAGFFIDLGVLHPSNETRYILGVECDGAAYHSSRSARDRDRIRQQILESRGWTIHRIWSTDWFHRRSQQEKRLLDALEHAVKDPKPIRSPVAMPARPLPSLGVVPDDSRPVSEPSRTAMPYEEASFRVSGQTALHEAPLAKVQDAVLKILTVEGPIHEDEVARRLAAVWGLERARSRTKERTLEALRSLEEKCDANGEKGFWTAKSGRPLKVRDRSATESPSLRKSEYLPPNEIVLAATEVVRANVSLALDELLVEVARRFGFLRTGPDLQDVISKAIATQIGRKFERRQDGSITLSQTPSN